MALAASSKGGASPGEPQGMLEAEGVEWKMIFGISSIYMTYIKIVYLIIVYRGSVQQIEY